MIKFNKETKQLEIEDNYAGRLKSSRIMSTIILVMAVARLYLIDWNKVKEMDYIFCLVAVVFLFFCYKNFFINTAINKIDKHNIKLIKMPKGFGTKIVIQLNNRKSRDVFGYKTVEEKNKLRKLASDAKITVRN